MDNNHVFGEILLKDQSFFNDNPWNTKSISTLASPSCLVVQTSVKCRDLAYAVEPRRSLKIVRIWQWYWKSDVFSQLQLQAQFFYIYQLSKGLGMRKISAHGIRMQENPQTRADIFLNFHRFSWSYLGPKSNLHPHTEISSMALLTPKSSIVTFEKLQFL